MMQATDKAVRFSLFNDIFRFLKAEEQVEAAAPAEVPAAVETQAAPVAAEPARMFSRLHISRIKYAYFSGGFGRGPR